MSTEQTNQPSESASTVQPQVEAAPIESSSPSVPNPTPEPEPPFWASRKYIKRSFSFMFDGVYVEGNFWQRPDGQVDIDGLYGTMEYESTDHLIKLSGASNTKRDNLISKVRSFLSN